ncbi:MAG: hypothetical protein JXA37_13175 [Chloroflexia bacterium]|nr:hypothetical protein [Chloroflexia bacterium]
MKTKPYVWTKRDKWLYALSMAPFLTVFVGTAYLLSTYSIWLTIILIGLYVLTNVFQAGCCVGCPYRGAYCPALCGVYLGNFLSGILYKERTFEAKFFERNAAAGETMVLILILFPLYWVFRTGWYLVPIYLLLIALHFVLFMPTQCEKCGYNSTCPGGKAWTSCRNRFGFRRIGEC